MPYTLATPKQQYRHYRRLEFELSRGLEQNGPDMDPDQRQAIRDLIEKCKKKQAILLERFLDCKE